MKRTILVVLMVAFLATPCLAQEVETNGIFFLHGTLWTFGPEIVFNTFEPFIETREIDYEYGFYQGEVYECFPISGCFPFTSPKLLISTPVLGILYTPHNNAVHYLQPTLGIGVYGRFGCMLGPFGCQGGIAMMYKVDNNWIPPDVE